MTKVLAFCVENIASFSQGVVYPLEALAKQGFLAFRWKLSRDLTDKDVKWCDVVIACRSNHPDETRFLKCCRDAKKYTIYCTDDDLLGIPPKLHGNETYRMQQSRVSIYENMCMCDCLYTYNELLTKKYKYIFDRALTFKSFSMLVEKISQKRTNKRIKQKNGSVVRIGFSGSATHEEEVNRLLEEPCLRIQNEYPQIEFEFFGVKPSFAKQLKNVTLTEYMPIEEYVEYMAGNGWDIGLAPLQETEFSKYKCYNKFMEYGASGIAGIYSEVMPFKLIVEEGENGIYAENTPEAWYKAMRRLVSDEKLRQKIAEKASEQIREKFSQQQFVGQFLEKIPELSTYKAPEKNKKRADPSIKYTQYKKTKIWQKVKEHFSAKGIVVGTISLGKKLAKKAKQLILGGRNA